MDFQGNIVFDSSKSDGQYKKTADNRYCNRSGTVIGWWWSNDVLFNYVIFLVGNFVHTAPTFNSLLCLKELRDP